jgi:hypothetical protein
MPLLGQLSNPDRVLRSLLEFRVATRTVALDLLRRRRSPLAFDAKGVTCRYATAAKL